MHGRALAREAEMTAVFAGHPSPYTKKGAGRENPGPPPRASYFVTATEIALLVVAPAALRNSTVYS